MNRIQQILNSQTSKNNVNTDTFLKINVESKERLLPPDEINKVVNVSDVFNNERQNSTFYRILGSINLNASNPLFNLDDPSFTDLYTWKGFNYQDPSNSKYRFNSDAYPSVLNDNLKENNGWFGYYSQQLQQSGLNKFYDMEPKRNRFSFLPDIRSYHLQSTSPIKNWELTITYPFSSDTKHPMVSDGLMIVEARQVVVSTRTMVAFGLACRHNLNIGDSVKISGTSGYDGEHVVVRTGLDDGALKEYYFVIDLPPTGIISGASKIKKVVGGVESEYYFRLFKKIKTRNFDVVKTDDYDTYKLAFSENIFADDVVQFVFNEDIDVSNLTDNLNRPLSELYLTTIKTNSGSGSDKLFSNVSDGIESPFINTLNNSDNLTYLLDIPVINKIHNGGTAPFKSHNPFNNDVTINDEFYYGDLVEFNSFEIKETILADVCHRFNTVNRETSPTMNYKISSIGQTKTLTLGPRQEGYFYKAHYQIKIRNFSDYIEQGDQNTIDLPIYAINSGDGTYLWRDLTEIGTNGLDYPFLNGCHYMYDNYIMMVRRQDPYGLWNLYYDKFPADPTGISYPNNFDVNSSEDVC